MLLVANPVGSATKMWSNHADTVAKSVFKSILVTQLTSDKVRAAMEDKVRILYYCSSSNVVGSS